MQKVQQIILVVFGIAIIALFVIVFNENKNSVVTNESKNNDTTVHKEHKIAFVNVDSLLKKYKFYEVLEQKLMDKQKSLESDLNRKMVLLKKKLRNFNVKCKPIAF
jgi:outer membrane protein